MAPNGAEPNISWGDVMRDTFIALAGAALLLLAGAAVAQDAQYAYATYFMCSPDGESRADEIINSSYKPHYDAAVEHGDIQSWSWMQHYAGGEWRRVLVVITSDMESLLDSSGALGEIISEQTPEAGRAFSGICSSHVDYIWQSTPGIGSGAPTSERGAAGFTAYMECDMNKEERADELIEKVFAPIYNKHVGDGGLTSWNWLKHYLGGKYRRILTMGAADHKTLMSTRDAIFADLEGNRTVERAVDEMNEICGSHEDYIWDILIQVP